MHRSFFVFVGFGSLKGAGGGAGSCGYVNTTAVGKGTERIYEYEKISLLHFGVFFTFTVVYFGVIIRTRHNAGTKYLEIVWYGKGFGGT